MSFLELSMHSQRKCIDSALLGAKPSLLLMSHLLRHPIWLVPCLRIDLTGVYLSALHSLSPLLESNVHGDTLFLSV
jgi:hypothetical protein